METLFHCLRGTILQIEWRMTAIWEFDVPPKKEIKSERDGYELLWKLGACLAEMIG